MLFLVLVNEALEVLMHGVEECVNFFQARLGQRLDLTDSLVDHGCQLLSFICVLFGCQVKLVKQNLAHLDDLFMSEFEVFVGDRHAEVAVNKVCQAIDILIIDNCWKLRSAELLTHTSSDTWKTSG